MNYVFEIVDKTGRSIRLTKKQWTHITITHSEMASYLGDIQKNLESPLKIIPHEVGKLHRYYTYLKHRKYPEKYLRSIGYCQVNET